MKLKHIKEFNDNSTIDYDAIIEKISDVYNIDVTKEELKKFESSDKFNGFDTISKYIISFIKFYLDLHDMEYTNENVACVTQGSVSGMGAVVSPTVGAIPGIPGEAGSGDIGSGWGHSIANNKNVRKRDSFLPRSRRTNKAKAAVKQMKKMKSDEVPFTVKGNNEVDHKPSKNSNIVKSFSEFAAKSK